MKHHLSLPDSGGLMLLLHIRLLAFLLTAARSLRAAPGAMARLGEGPRYNVGTQRAGDVELCARWSVFRFLLIPFNIIEA